MARIRPLVEQLEDRVTPVTTGVVWPDPGHLTLSFVPDGTSLGQCQSNLFSELNAIAPTATWQNEIMRAFQTWKAQADINVSTVADGGQVLGETGAPQGDARFGDIRIAAAPLASSAIATGTHFQWTGTTWAGDIVLNSNYDFSIGGSKTTYDLFTIILHEAGNALGLSDNQTDTTSIMYSTYQGARTQLSTGDIADIQSLYGTPESKKSKTLFTSIAPTTTGKFLDIDLHADDTLALADRVTPRWGSATDLRFQVAVQASISDASDLDVYRFNSPSASKNDKDPITMVVMVWGTDAVRLSPKLHIYDSHGKIVASEILANERGVFTLQVRDVTPNKSYYAEVSSLDGKGPNNVGNYFLGVNFHTQPPVNLPMIAADSLSDSRPSASGNLTVNHNGVFQFVLTAWVGNSKNPSDVTMTIRDKAGNVVKTMTVGSDQPNASTAIYLSAGAYTFTFSAKARDGSSMNPTWYGLQIGDLSDPIGPYTTSGDGGCGGSNNGSGYSSDFTINGAWVPYWY